MPPRADSIFYRYFLLRFLSGGFIRPGAWFFGLVVRRGAESFTANKLLLMAVVAVELGKQRRQVHPDGVDDASSAFHPRICA